MVSSHPLAFVATIFTPTSDIAAIVALHESVGSRPLPPREPEDIRGPHDRDCLLDARWTPNMAPIHFCFVVHGHQGRPTDLSYIHDAIKSKAKENGSFVYVKSSAWRVGAEATATGNHANKRVRREKRDRLPSSESRKKKNEIIDDLEATFITVEKVQTKGNLVVHNAACNEGKTSDGIIKGGERLVHEMLSVIRFEFMRKEDPQQQEESSQQGHIDITLSVIGNSLGGLYGRYAIAHIAEILCEPTHEADKACNYFLLDGCIRIYLNVFCSIACPHLGCSGFTYFPIPRPAEMAVAKVMGETGSDLFRINDLLLLMANSPRFLTPLASFQRRIAYANAYGTDFPVPGSTAAFLDKKSDYPHCFDDQEKANGCPASESGLIAATLYTKQNFRSKANVDDDLTAMSSSLDSLGWRKILVDIRMETPSISLPMFESWGSRCPISQLKSLSSEVRSSDLARAISTSSSCRIGLPLGHNAICAFSRGAVSTALNSGGRPVMDSLALDLTDDISQWKV